MMKLIFKSAVLALSVSPLANADAHAMTISEVHAATKIALDEYMQSSPSTADKVYAFQGSIAGDDAAVKLFIKNGTETTKVNYTCHKHGAQLECHLQGE